MSNIISINHKLQLAKEKKADLVKKRKMLAVHKVFQCTHCAFKCEKCGSQIHIEHYRNKSENRKLRIPYRFCESCMEEYIDYMDRLSGTGNPDFFWHNEIWLEGWKKWIDYQSTMNRYLKSKEFMRLLQELKQTEPNQ